MKSGIALSILQICVLFPLLSLADSDNHTIFPVLENLKQNVTFWKKIYTQVSINEVLIHDSEFPGIIYQKVFKGDLTGKQLDKYLVKPVNRIVGAIKAVQEQEVTSWDKLAWEIASIYLGYPPEALENAHKRVRFQQGQRERFIDGLKRSGAYLDTIKMILGSFDLPLELAYLPHVESSFNYDVYSKVGAAGIWQFMPLTGKAFLTVNRYIDERKDPILSTYAAARLLARNYGVLQSWPLSLTAYNHGITGVLKAIEQTGSRDMGIIVKEYSSPTFRFASKNFYSCFVAASHAADSAYHYFGPVEYEKPYNRKDVILLHSMTASEISAVLGISRDEFLYHNPSILSNTYKSGFLLPAGTVIHISDSFTAGRLYNRVAFYYDSIPAIDSEYYVTREGDDMDIVAQKLNTTVEMLIFCNNVESKELSAGQILGNPEKLQIRSQEFSKSIFKNIPVTSNGERYQLKF